MNHFDDEVNIISLFQYIETKEIFFVNPTREAKRFFQSLYRKRKFKNWINSSGKDAPPPDFYSEKYGYMLEVMRVDDYAVGNNSPNALESKFIKKADEERRKNGLPSIKESNIHILLIPDMSKASKNDYRTYVENFKRIVAKHIEKIESYRNNHPGYELGFLILDESPGYILPMDPNVIKKPGGLVKGNPHLHFYDKNFVESFLDAELDFVIWMTPYKNIAGNPKIYPLVSIFDLKRNNDWRKNILEYSYDEMVCLETE